LNNLVIFPDNETRTDIIINECQGLSDSKSFKVFPSIRCEYFLTLLKNPELIIRNSSTGVREAPHFDVPFVNLGPRQDNRLQGQLMMDTSFSGFDIIYAIDQALIIPRTPESSFGDGRSAEQFYSILTKTPI
jgi:UDP-N-acetylglucosamine 2-epimerase (hydrolysing)